MRSLWAALYSFSGTDDTLEGRRDVGEVDDTATDDEGLALGMPLAVRDEVDDGFRVLVRLTLSQCAGVLAVVSEFVGKAVGSNGGQLGRARSEGRTG